MIHSLLSSLPDIYDDDAVDAATDLKSESPPPTKIQETESILAALEDRLSVKTEGNMNDDFGISGDANSADCSSQADDATLVGESAHSDGAETTLSSVLEDEPTLVSEVTEKTSHTPLEPSTDTVGSFQTAPESADPEGSSQLEEAAAAQSARRPRTHISTLLEQADELFARYPPMVPSVNLPSIMGPKSVMLTWTEDPTRLPADDEAEMMVLDPQHVVYPAPSEKEGSREEEIEEEKDDRSQRLRRRRRLRKPRKIGSMVIERKAVVASAVLVLGVAMAVYGLHAIPERHHSHTASRELRRVGKHMGGVVLGMGGRLWDGLMAMATV